LGVESFDKAKGFVFPNPATTVINIQNDGAPIRKAVIYNSIGAMLQMESSSDIKRMDVGKLQQGIYLLQVEDGNGHKMTHKFSVKN